MRSLVVAISISFALALGLGGLAAAAEPPRPRPREVLRERPSGFWTSNRPAENGAYRWRLLAIGGGLVLVTGLVMWRLVRRASAQRAAR